MKTLILAAAATAGLGLAAASTANAFGNCEEWMCGMNGTQLTGTVAQAVKAKQPVVNIVTLPSGEAVDLR
jgi:hypothetical protein